MAYLDAPLTDRAQTRWETLARTGVDGVEVACGNATLDEFGPFLTQTASHWANRCPVRALAITVRSMHPAESTSQIEHWLRFAADCDATHLNLALADVGGDPGGLWEHATAINFLHELLQKVRASAESTGVAVGLEADDHGPCSPVELRELIDEANTWAIGACIDATRWSDPRAPIDWLRTLHRRVTCVRVPRSGADAVSAAIEELRLDGPVIKRT